MPMNCSKCGQNSKYPICWKCQKTDIQEQAYAMGHQAGYLKGQREAPTAITAERHAQLVRLCHPDKHGDSRLSTEVFQWLQTVKPQ